MMFNVFVVVPDPLMAEIENEYRPVDDVIDPVIRPVVVFKARPLVIPDWL